MFEFIDVRRCDLTLDGETIGYRYCLNFDDNREYTWDMEFDIAKKFEKAILNVCSSIQKGKSIAGKEVDGVFRTSWERGVSEIDSTDTLKKMLKEFSVKAEAYAKLKSDAELYISKLKRSLRNEGISYEDGREMEDGLCFSCRFIGGFGAWSGCEEDICDADVLDRKVASRVDKVVKGLKKELGKGHDIYWTTGEKAWTYFYFRLLEK